MPHSRNIPNRPPKRHRHDRKVIGVRRTLTRNIQAHKAIVRMKIVYQNFNSDRKNRKVQPQYRPEDTSTKYTTKSTTTETTTTRTEELTSMATALEAQFVAIAAQLAQKQPNVIRPFPFQVRNIVGITQPDGTERLAMISETTSFHDRQIAIVCAWLYTRAEIADDLVRNDGVSRDEAQSYLHSIWPMGDGIRSQFNYMLSTERTVAVSDGTDTYLKVAPEHVAATLCRDAVYDSSSGERRICGVGEVECSWLKEIL